MHLKGLDLLRFVYIQMIRLIIMDKVSNNATLYNWVFVTVC